MRWCSILILKEILGTREVRQGFTAETTTLSAPNVFVIRFVDSEDDFAK